LIRLVSRHRSAYWRARAEPKPGPSLRLLSDGMLDAIERLQAKAPAEEEKVH
jgi:hypothetical protein